MADNTERLEQLRKVLEKEVRLPSIYMFKFIVPNNNHSLELVMSLFDESSEINSRVSANGKYISLTAREMMLSVDSIIEKYKSAFTIEGLIAL